MSLDADFFESLSIASMDLWLNEPMEAVQLADGSVLRAPLGAPLWAGTATLVPAHHATQGRFEARIARLMRPGQSFLAYDPRYTGPAYDPGGVILGAATPTIHTLDPDNRRLRVTGLPVGYELRAGDWIGWTYGTDPVRYALHRVETDAIADAGGLTPLFAVEPHIRAGVATSAAVELVQPKMKAIMLAAEYGASAPVISAGPRFEFTQVLR